MRFTIRDLLWLMVVVALAASWGVREWQVISREKAAKALADQSVAELKSLNEMLFELQRVKANEAGSISPSPPNRP